MKYAILILIFFCSCNNPTIDKVNPFSKINKEEILKKKLIGFWGALDENRPVYEFRDSVICYCEDSICFPYSIAHDSIILNFNDGKSKSIWINANIIDDTLFYLPSYPSEEIMTKAYRFKNWK